MAEESRLRAVPAPRALSRRALVLFLLVGFVLILLLFNLAGFRKTLAFVQEASPAFILCILILQALRYVASSGSTFVLAEVFGARLPFLSLYETMMTGQALNRTFSVGGAAGMWARYSFMTRQGMHSGPVAALLLVEDVIGAAAICLVFAIGLLVVLNTLPLSPGAWLFLSALAFGFAIFAIVGIILYRQRRLLEWVAHFLGRLLNRVLVRLTGKTYYTPEAMSRIIEEFYAAVSHARRDRARLFIAFVCNALRLGVDAASLFFAFWAVGFAISPGICLVLFTSSSVLSTLAAAPGELGVMDASLAVMATAVGIDPPVAVSATLLFRALSYWLPIPIGYLTFGHLESQGLI